MKPKMIPLIAAISIMASSLAPAVILAQYNFASGVVTSSDPAGDGGSGNFSVNNGSTVGGGAGFSGGTHMAFFRSDGLTASEMDAVAAPDYFSFTYTPDAGSYQLTSLTLLFGGSSNTDANGTFTSHVSLRSDAEAVDYSSVLGSSSKVIGNADADNHLDAVSFDLSGFAELQTITAPVTFRLYVYAENAGLSSEILRMDDVVLNGNLVPEPSVAVLGALAAFGLIRRRR